MSKPKIINTKLSEHELEKIKVEQFVETMFSRDECRVGVLNAARYLEKNGPAGIFSDSAIDVIDAIAFAFVSGELDWVKNIERDEENDEGRV